MSIGVNRSERIQANTDYSVQSAAFHPSIFGERLDHIMSQQMEAGSELPIPRILPFLAESIIALCGTRTEGIFRLPGDFDSIGEMKARLDRGEYHLVSRCLPPRYDWTDLKAEDLADRNRRSSCLDLTLEIVAARAGGAGHPRRHVHGSTSGLTGSCSELRACRTPSAHREICLDIHNWIASVSLKNILLF